jgi:hypothetical protein
MSTNTKRVSKVPTVKVPTLSEGQVFIHNKSRGEFHVPLVNGHPNAQEEPIVFELNEVRKVKEDFLKEQRFIDCIEKGFLEVFSEEDYAKHLKEAERAKAAETRKSVAGNHESGLPNNRTMAIQQISMIDDTDLLEALLEKETRASILAAIEERIEELDASNDIT